VTITASVLGTGAGSTGTTANQTVRFDASHQLQRAGLLLSKGIVYLAFASHDDYNPYHGWVLGYDAHTLARTFAFDASPNDS